MMYLDFFPPMVNESTELCNAHFKLSKISYKLVFDFSSTKMLIVNIGNRNHGIHVDIVNLSWPL